MVARRGRGALAALLLLLLLLLGLGSAPREVSAKGGVSDAREREIRAMEEQELAANAHKRRQHHHGQEDVQKAGQGQGQGLRGDGPPQAEQLLSRARRAPRHHHHHPRENFAEVVRRCSNHTACLGPDLLLRGNMKAHFCRHTVDQGVRFRMLVSDGLQTHPRVHIVPTIEEADFVLWSPVATPPRQGDQSCFTQAARAGKLVVLDEGDFQSPWRASSELKPGVAAYFKRSFVARHNGVFLDIAPMPYERYYPLTYSVATGYIAKQIGEDRPWDVVCSLRTNPRQPHRNRVAKALDEYVKAHPKLKAHVGQVSGGGRKAIDKSYFSRMRNTKILVTANPTYWEGDFRLWESLATGALIFVDPIYVPHPFPLQHGKHLIFFHTADDLVAKLDYYLAHPEEARAIALAGYVHALRYHRTANMIDYIFRTLHDLQLRDELPQLSHGNRNGTTGEEEKTDEDDDENGERKLEPIYHGHFYLFTGPRLVHHAKMQLARQHEFAKRMGYRLPSKRNAGEPATATTKGPLISEEKKAALPDAKSAAGNATTAGGAGSVAQPSTIALLMRLLPTWNEEPDRRSMHTASTHADTIRR